MNSNMGLNGIAVSGGIAIGKVKKYIPCHIEVTQTHIEEKDIAAELEKYKSAKAKALVEIEKLKNNAQSIGEDRLKIFDAHADILDDEEINEQVEEMIKDQHSDVLWAIQTVYTQYAEILAAMENELIRERAADMEDVKLRLLRIMQGQADVNLSMLEQPCVIVCNDLLPSDTVSLDRKNTLGILAQKGGVTSHSAILARTMGIPAVLGVPNVLSMLRDGQDVILDGSTGKVIIDPTSDMTQEYMAAAEKYLQEKNIADTFLEQSCMTRDGVKIEIGLNVGDVSNESLTYIDYADFVGLFRTEFLFMNAADFPTEEEQFSAYKKILCAAKGKAVTLRTLDIGGDKTLSYFNLPKEENPFLGQRALRLCFANPELFKTQLRAALRASVFGKLNLMLPMVGSIDDIINAKEIIEQVKQELDQQNLPYSNDFKIGAMIEIPSIALIADLLAEEVDFASIGTNDLCQYLTAVDRTNASVSEYYQDFHPAMFRTIRYTATAFAKANKQLSVCGELGGNPLAVPLLVGLGLRKLSMGKAALAQAKYVISRYSMNELEKLANDVLLMKTADEIKNMLNEVLF